jgi:hypothetical protein
LKDWETTFGRLGTTFRRLGNNIWKTGKQHLKDSETTFGRLGTTFERLGNNIWKIGKQHLEDWETFSGNCPPPSSRRNSDASSSVYGYQHIEILLSVFKAEQKGSFCSTSNRILASENSVSRIPTPKT